MRKFIKKIVGIFMIIGIYLVKFANKIYAEDTQIITPEYGVIEPEPWKKVLNGIFFILLPISAIITIIVGTRKYIKSSTDGKSVKILISIIAVIGIVILIRVLVLGINIY